MLSLQSRELRDEEISEPSPQQHILQPSEGEVLKLGPSASGEVIVKVDPHKVQTSFAAGTETLLPGAEIPVHRHLQQDEVLFVHKGQGRALLEGRTVTVVPGVLVYVPRHAWHGLRNTGTGVLQIAWMSAPPGIEEFFRECARAGSLSDPAAVQALAERFGIEFRSPGEAAKPDTSEPAHPHRRRRRGGRGRRGRGRAPVAAATQQQPAAPSEPAHPQERQPSATAQGPEGSASGPGAFGSAPARSSRPRRHRRHHGRSVAQRSSGAPPPSPGQQVPQETARPQTAPARRVHAEGSGRKPGGRPHRPRRVKEVYMGGRWVPVVGEGPVIAGGDEREKRRRKPSGGDQDTPGGPLSVAL